MRFEDSLLGNKPYKGEDSKNNNSGTFLTNESKGPRTKMLLVYCLHASCSSCSIAVKAFHFYGVSALQFIVFTFLT